MAFLLSGRAGGLVVVGDVGDSGDAHAGIVITEDRWSHRTSGHSATARSVDARLVLSADPLVAPLAYDFVVVRDLARSLWAEPSTQPAAAAVVGLGSRRGARSAILLEGILREDLAWRPASIAMVLVLAPALLWRRTHTRFSSPPSRSAPASPSRSRRSPRGWLEGLNAYGFIIILIYALFRWGPVARP